MGKKIFRGWEGSEGVILRKWIYLAARRLFSDLDKELIDAATSAVWKFLPASMSFLSLTVFNP